MKGDLLLGISILLAIFVCIMSFHHLKGYKLNDSLDPSELNLKLPVSLSLPAKNCSCTMSLDSGTGAQLQKKSKPSFSCDCREATRALLEGPSGLNTTLEEFLKCPYSPSPEMRVEVKEVIKEVLVKKEHCPGVPWYAEGRTWHYPARFPLCSMDACFNFSKCEDAAELLVYAYDVPGPPAKFFSRINESPYYTNDPQKACIFLVFLDTSNPWPPHPRSLPYWNGGQNHVLVIFADKWSLKGPHPESIEYASIMATDIHETIYRAGFDISIPLPGLHHETELQSVKALERKYLATFRGTRFLGSKGEGTFRSQESFRNMHNGKDVIVVTSCNHVTNNLMRKADPRLGAHCDEDELLYAKYTSVDLLNSTFGLVPAGRQPSSSNFIEVLSAGAIPVLIADNYVKPFDTLIQWHKCVVQFPTTEMHRITGNLRALKYTKLKEVRKRQEYCLQIYNEFLKDDETLTRSAVRALKARFLGAIPSFTEARGK